MEEQVNPQPVWDNIFNRLGENKIWIMAYEFGCYIYMRMNSNYQVLYFKIYRHIFLLKLPEECTNSIKN